MAQWVHCVPKSSTSGPGIMLPKKSFSPVLSVSTIPSDILFKQVPSCTSFEDFSFSHLIPLAQYQSRKKRKFNGSNQNPWLYFYIYHPAGVKSRFHLHNLQESSLFLITRAFASFFSHSNFPKFVLFDWWQTLAWLSRPNTFEWLRWFSVGGIEANKPF